MTTVTQVSEGLSESRLLSGKEIPEINRNTRPYTAVT